MKKPIDYTIEPAKGQALLNFQGRRLPDKIELFETSLIEEVRQKGQKKITLDSELNADFRNILIHGDCLSACAYLKSENIKVDLVYIDPPFASGANYAKKVFLRTGNGKAAMENDTKEIGEEIMYSDIWQKEDYLNWLYERLLAIREVMNNTTVIYLHLDHTIGAYAKVIMDEVFGEENFLNTISWRCQVPRGMKSNSFYYPYSAQYLHIYSKNPNKEDITWNLQKRVIKITKEEAEEEYMKDELGYFRTSDPGSYGFDKLKELYNNNRIYVSKGGEIIIDEANREIKTTKGTIGIKYYLKPDGENYIAERTVDNIWDDIPGLGTVPSEDVNYSTQKTEALLTRVLEASSNKGMIVADFFSGSGVTAKVANYLERKFITCDIGINAIQTTRDRLVKAKAEFDVLKINDGVRLFRNPAQTVAKLFSLLDGYKDRAELGLGEFWDGGMINKRGTFTPVKFIGIDKKLTKELVDVIIEEVIGLEENNQEEVKTESGIEDKIPSVKIIYAYKQPEVNQEYVNKTIKQSKKTNIKAELVSLDELLSQKADVFYTPDNAVIEIKQDGKFWNVEIKKYFSSYLKNKIDDFNNKKVKPRQKTLDENGENGNGNGNENGEEKQNGKPKIQISESGLELIEAVQFDTTLRKDGVWTSSLELEDKAGVKEKIKAVYKLTTDKFQMKMRNISGDEIIIDSSEIKKN